MNFIKIKNFSTSKNTIKKVKKQPIEWGKIFANNVFYKESVYRIYFLKLLQLNNKQFKNGQKIRIRFL